MWTNVFKIGGLHQISWFQFLPSEADLNPSEKSVKGDEKDAATLLVLLCHLQLQNEGYLSTWTNSFVGPWDPSQGMHNPDEKIKLWLFLPGCHSSVVETAQPAVAKLRVVASGLWLAPGESEEVAAALSQALRNCIERALRELSYLRYGDVFTQCYPFSQSEKNFRRVQPAIEFVFAANDEAIYVHVKISAKHIRTLSSDDMERLLRRRSLHKSRERLPVIVAPHGMRGRLSGCCPSDLVKQVYLSSNKVKASNGFAVLSIPSNIAQASACQFRGQSCYVEVTLGCPANGRDKVVQSNSNFNRNSRKRHRSESPAVTLGKGDQKHGHFQVLEKTFLYPAEAVVVPVIHTSFVRSSLKRLWVQNLVGASLLGSYFLKNCSGFETIGNSESVDGTGAQYSNNSSSNSNSSSISSTSSDSDCRMTSAAGELEADADSLTSRQSGLPSNDQFDNDGHKQVKRPRTGTTEPFGAAGTVVNTNIGAYKSEYGSVEVNILATTGIANDQGGSDYWDDDDKEGMDIQVLLSDFGDFGDFFENDFLPFGEPPGTAESEALIYAAPDCGDVSSSPGIGVVDVTDQMLLPVLDLPSFDSVSPLPLAVTDESRSRKLELTKDTCSSGPVGYSSALSAGEFDHLSKAEAMMTFAPDYGAVETPANELSASIFRIPYLPISRKVETRHSSSNAYVYCATPPSSCLTVPDEKLDITEVNASSGAARQDSNHSLQLMKYYTHVKSGKEQNNIASNNSIPSCEAVTPALSGFNSVNAKSSQGRTTGSATEVGRFLLSLKTVLATEAQSMLFQANMCRIRHTLLSSSNLVPAGLLSGSGVSDPLPGDSTAMTDKISNRYDVKKKECIPVRIAGDFDGGMLDGPLSAPIGVWRSVGVPKGAKTTSSSSMDNTSSPHIKSFNEESRNTLGQREPLQDFLDALPLLVQQATSFVDVALDAEYCDGPFAWLALEEQCRRGFSCGPSMVHAGCGGLLASCHSLDIAGVELLDPLSANVHASSVISLLHSDIKVALKLAFGNLDGPLSVTDWCKSRSHLGDAGIISDTYTGESIIVESKDSSNTVSLAVGEPTSPTNSSVSSATDGMRVDETIQRRMNQEVSHSESDQQMMCSRPRPTLFVLPLPAILVGYQDDWLKTSANSLQVWEKAPLEPYALPKPMTYYVICPDIDPLTSAAADFFQQLGSVYETCKLGTHAPQHAGGQMDLPSRKWKSSGFLLIDCPQKMKIESANASVMGSISDYLLALSSVWDLRSFLESLSNAIKSQRFDSTINQKEGSDGPGLVIYVVCPFPDPVAVLQTMIASSTALGSTVLSSDKDRRSLLHTQVAKALGCSAVADEASVLNVLGLSGFSIPKVALQIVSVESILRVTSPALNELSLLKEIAFTVYNKVRRVARGPCNDAVQSLGVSVRTQSTLMPINSPTSGIWKDCVASRMSGSLPREGELDSLRPGAWDNSWQASRSGGISCEPNKVGDNYFQDDTHFLFEPLFILAEPGSVEQGVSPTVGTATSDSSRPSCDDGYGGTFLQSSSSLGADIGASSILDGPDPDGLGSSSQKNPSLHCCYGWTEDWRWLVCIWTDSRGELLDSHIFPFGGISSRQDTKGLQSLFVQVLHQGCQILSCTSTDIGAIKPRDIIITRVGCFYELERQEWQKAIYLVGGTEVKKWPLQLRKGAPDGISASSNGSSLPQQEMSLIQERNLPSSPNPSLYAPQTKGSGFIKSGIGQTNARKPLMARQAAVDCSRGLFQWVHSICLIGVSIDNSLHLISQADTSFPGGAQGGGVSGPLGYLEGFSTVKSLGSLSASYVVIPSSSMQFLPPTPLQLPTCLTSDSPPLAHLLHSKGAAIPLSTGFVVSKAVASIRNDCRSSTNEDWPSVLSVSLVDYYGSSNLTQEKLNRGSIKQSRNLKLDVRDHEIEVNLILEFVAAELHALSWMTVSPAYLERRTALPFHCDMILRLRRIIHFADKELCEKLDKSHV